jgi:CheY-like chemotaxis protein
MRSDAQISVLEPSDSSPVDILIADDEPIVRRVLEMALRSSGLRVATAVNGMDAVRVFRQHLGDVRLVVLDVQMPELDGPQACRALRDIAPDVRVLFMSGGSGNYSIDDLLDAGAIGYIEKPFRNVTEVAERLRKAAAAPAAHLR